ncbi:hypothetical protein KDD30_18200 (plasmid) [Photobacterium sp. GJ3]|uniref:hypothetical protein n=1 Tax=Photobacterium sp. GJ3 TaxID=2829502 RepID=UPI001B8D49BA|nr:hypothetical protein [Photobacterium sp. GJ3]QUJ70082.1 hypothetical protein KDD30_18200 [Photobacterium sp. GJ3]
MRRNLASLIGFIFIASGSFLIADEQPPASDFSDPISLVVDLIHRTQADISAETRRSDVSNGPLFHPVAGYAEFEQIWCLSAKYSVQALSARVQGFCEAQQGEMRGEWCSHRTDHQPLFSVTFDWVGSQCAHQGTLAGVHVFQPIKPANPEGWLQFAVMMGFLPYQP